MKAVRITKEFTCQHCRQRFQWKGTIQELEDIIFSRGQAVSHERFGKPCSNPQGPEAFSYYRSDRESRVYAKALGYPQL